MDPSKIQIESRQDLTYLKTVVQNWMESNIEFNSKQHLQALDFLDYVFEVCAANCQVNGIDYNLITKQGEEYEPLDEELLTKLAEIQEKRDQVLLSVVKQRKQVPQQIDELTKHLIQREKDSLESDLEKVKSCSSVVDKLPNFEVPKNLRKIPENFEILSRLSTNIPEVSEKLNRAKIVLMQEGHQRVKENIQ